MTPHAQTKTKPSRILLVSSGGGHWVQLLRLRPAFVGHQVSFVTVLDAYRSDIDDDAPFYVINDATRWDKLGLARMCLRLLLILIRVRPHLIVSTGAAPGYFALRFGKLMGAKTIWIDSIANVEEMSMTGRLVRKYADLWLTQWPHLATEDGPTHLGAVI